MTTRAQVVAEARDWLGTKYQHQQRLKGVAVDCAGLVIGVCRALGLLPASFDVQGYARSPDGSSLVAHCDANLQRIGIGELQPGDVLVIRWERDPQHLGIVGNYLHGGLSLIHALDSANGKGKVIEHRLSAEYLARSIAAYRIPGVLDDARTEVLGG